jgi:Fe-S cluster assembly scaffold protein SufB
MKRTFDKLGIPEAEQKFLAGVGAQYDSEVVYHKIKESLEKQGVIFLSCDQGLKEHEALFKQYFGTVIPSSDNKFAALNSAVWSGGSFIYVPKGVKVDVPLQAYFRINTKDMGQFERTLIIVDEDAYVHYVEGCTAPIYASDSLHSAVVEIIVKKGGRCRYTTIQNWSNNVYNLVTKRAVAYANATMEWVDGNLGCLTGDAGVMCNSDVRPISQIEPGDHVYSLNGEMQWDRRRVVAKKHTGRQQVYRLRTENHREVRATANHPFLALTKTGKHTLMAWKRLDELTTDDLVAVFGALPDHTKSESKDRKGVRLPAVSSEEGTILARDRGVLATRSQLAVGGDVALDEGDFSEQAFETSLSFSPVSSIEPQGIEDTWDIEVEGSHNFVANGLVVHNSKLTMKYPAIYMMEPGAHGEVLSIAFAGKGQHQDAGGKAVHCAPNTSSKIISKSISKDGGRAGYRGLVKEVKGAENCRSTVNCDALILDEESRSDTYPYMEIEEDKVTIGHEATVSKIGDEQLFYLMARGIPEEEAAAMIVSGFIEPVVKELPMEYAVEMNRLIQLQMEGSVG